MRVVGLFTLCVTVAVACSMVADSAMSAKSERLLYQEGTGNLKKITKSPANAGGLQALAQFTRRVVSMGLTNTTSTEKHTAEAKKAALHAAAVAKVHASLHGHVVVAHPGAKGATAHKRLAALALSKLQDEGADSNSTAPEEEAAAPAETEAATNDADDKPDDKPDDRFDSEAHPGWDEKRWDTSDWTVWTLTGPVLTMTAAMFIFYTYGWQWAVGTLLVLVGCDMFGFYYNV